MYEAPGDISLGAFILRKDLCRIGFN